MVDQKFYYVGISIKVREAVETRGWSWKRITSKTEIWKHYPEKLICATSPEEATHAILSRFNVFGEKPTIRSICEVIPHVFTIKVRGNGLHFEYQIKAHFEKQANEMALEHFQKEHKTNGYIEESKLLPTEPNKIVSFSKLS